MHSLKYMSTLQVVTLTTDFFTDRFIHCIEDDGIVFVGYCSIGRSLGCQQ